MDAVTLRKGLSARVGSVTGLREAQGPMGLEMEPSTVIDLTENTPQVLRKGKGSLAPFAVESV